MTVEADRSRLRALLGDLPVRAPPPPGTLRDRRNRGDAIIEDWRLDLSDAVQVPTTVVIPQRTLRAIGEPKYSKPDATSSTGAPVGSGSSGLRAPQCHSSK